MLPGVDQQGVHAGSTRWCSRVKTVVYLYAYRGRGAADCIEQLRVSRGCSGAKEFTKRTFCVTEDVVIFMP